MENEILSIRVSPDIEIVCKNFLAKDLKKLSPVGLTALGKLTGKFFLGAMVIPFLKDVKHRQKMAEVEQWLNQINEENLKELKDMLLQG